MKLVALLAVTAALSAVATCARAADREADVTMVTPATVQLTSWCQRSDRGCAQNAADIAQDRCQRYRRNAQLLASDLIERELSGREKFGYRFACVP